MFRRPVKERFIVLAISTGQPKDAEINQAMLKIIESYQPTHWRFGNSENFHVYFRCNDGKAGTRANGLYQAVVELIKQDDDFAHFKIGLNEGMLISKVNLIGGISFEPLGKTVQEASNLQKGKSELVNGT